MTHNQECSPTISRTTNSNLSQNNVSSIPIFVLQHYSIHCVNSQFPLKMALKCLGINQTGPCAIFKQSAIDHSANSTNVGLVEHRPFLTSGNQCSDALVYVQNVPQDSQHFCLVKLWTAIAGDQMYVCCACHFNLPECGMARTEYSKQS